MKNSHVPYRHRQAWSRIDEVIAALEARGMTVTAFSEIHYRASFPRRGTVDFWPTTGKWWSAGRTIGSTQGDELAFICWVDRIIGVQANNDALSGAPQ